MLIRPKDCQSWSLACSFNLRSDSGFSSVNTIFHIYFAVPPTALAAFPTFLLTLSPTYFIPFPLYGSGGLMALTFGGGIAD